MSSVTKLPTSVLDGVQNFALDFGGSMIKIAYIKKNDQHPKGYTLVHHASFARSNLQDAIDFIRRECDIPTSDSGEPKEYILTGLGTQQFHKVLTDQLNIKVRTVWEMGCFFSAFKVLTDHLSESELFYPALYNDEDGKTKELVEALSNLLAHLGTRSDPDQDPDVSGSAEERSGPFPCLMVMLGSAFVMHKIQRDEVKSHGLMSNRGGRTFLGLGSLLTGAKTYDELMELAEKGSDRAIHCFTRDLVKRPSEDNQNDNIYDKLSQFDANCFSFGWCAGKEIGDFKREDLARGLLTMICQDLGLLISTSCEKLNVWNVILVGGFAQSPLARKLIEYEFQKHTAVYRKLHQKSILGYAGCRTVKAGSHLGALGAMFQSKSQGQTPAQGETQAQCHAEAQRQPHVHPPTPSQPGNPQL